MRHVTFARALRTAVAVSARHLASLLAKQAAASLIRSARRAIRKTETIEDIAWKGDIFFGNISNIEGIRLIDGFDRQQVPRGWYDTSI